MRRSLLIILIGSVIGAWIAGLATHIVTLSLPHRKAAVRPVPVHYQVAPPGVVELDRGHYWIRNGYAMNAWHLCEHGIDRVDHSNLDDAGNTLYGHYQLQGGAVLVCKSPNDHYLFVVPKKGQ